MRLRNLPWSHSWGWKSEDLKPRWLVPEPVLCTALCAVTWGVAGFSLRVSASVYFWLLVWPQRNTYLLKEILCYPWPCSVSDCQQEQLKWGEDGAEVLCSAVGRPEAVVSQCEVPGCQTGLNLEFRTLQSSKWKLCPVPSFPPGSNEDREPVNDNKTDVFTFF